ncbi:CDGSH iron-sulfur domain-containing protein [Streptomyces smyrnaeus]|uniref:CDGSH iron-sulfur domain-containing protein n=1 Tax=Streptomyces smyrnaeus TaxID=1387713 RepID=UPI0037AFD5FB
MPTSPDEPHPQRSERRRVTLEQGGPVLVEGPVEVRLDDGSTVFSDRFMTALCTCRRSRTYPWCDTSHRRRSRTRSGATGSPATETNGAPGPARAQDSDPRKPGR